MEKYLIVLLAFFWGGCSSIKETVQTSTKNKKEINNLESTNQSHLDNHSEDTIKTSSLLEVYTSGKISQDVIDTKSASIEFGKKLELILTELEQLNVERDKKNLTILDNIEARKLVEERIDELNTLLEEEIGPLYFKNNETTISSSNNELIKKQVIVINEFHDKLNNIFLPRLGDKVFIKMIVLGYSSPEGKKETNTQLSNERAISVQNHLYKHFVNGGKKLLVCISGKGQSVPAGLADSTDYNKRRVAIVKIGCVQLENKSICKESC